MEKMNLDYLLAPASGNSKARRGSGEHSSRGISAACSADYTAPRHSSNDHDRSKQRHRRSSDRSSQNRSTGSSSKAPPKEKRSQSSKPNPKPKKTKTPTPPPPSEQPESEEAKPYPCANCDRSFYKLEQLKRHDRLVHQNLRPFRCKSCDLSFGTKQNMQVHLTTRKHRHRLHTLTSGGKKDVAGSSRNDS